MLRFDSVDAFGESSPVQKEVKMQTRAAQMIADQLATEDNERDYFESFPFHPGRTHCISKAQHGYLYAILPSVDTLVTEYQANVIPGR